MSPILEFLLFVVSEDVIDLETLRPRINEPFLRPFEIVFDMTLATNVSAHLLTRRLIVDVEIAYALRGFESTNTFDETGPCDAQLHRRRIMTIDTRDRMSDKLRASL